MSNNEFVKLMLGVWRPSYLRMMRIKVMQPATLDRLASRRFLGKKVDHSLKNQERRLKIHCAIGFVFCHVLHTAVIEKNTKEGGGKTSECGSELSKCQATRQRARHVRMGSID